MTRLHNAKYHILAILTVAVWGTTFISTKVLITNGLTPHAIFFIRFVIASVCFSSCMVVIRSNR